jgi:soluble lytic murein transglycosylase-like protein
LFQLNNLSFPNLTVEDFYNPNLNIKLGIAYMKQLYERFGTWEAVAISYNWGPTAYASKNVPPEKVIEYFGKIMGKERELDGLFTDYFYRQFSYNGSNKA